MRAYIKKLQAKEEDTRKLIFIGSLILCMSFVSFVWVYGLGYRFDTKMKEQAREDIKPFKLFSDSISSTYQNVTASVGKININSKKENTLQKQIELIPVEYSATQ